MFNLDELEKNWQEYYKTKTGKDKLSDKDVLEVYKSENATMEYYEEQYEKYRNYFKNLWGMVRNSAEDRLITSIHDCDPNLGWDEDISNIDKDEFLRKFEEDLKKEEEDKKKRIEDWQKKIYLKMQIENLPDDNYFETHTVDPFDDELVVKIFLQKEEEKKNRLIIEKIYQKEEEERQRLLDERIAAESNYDLSNLHALFSENNNILCETNDNTKDEFIDDIKFELNNEDIYISYKELYADDMFDVNKDYDIEPKKEETKEEYQEKIRKRNIATRIIMEKEKIEEPKKKYLSFEKQKEVVEGCMYLVFDYTHFWDNATGHVFDVEEIYYLCLHSLISTTKYCCHCKKPVFSLLVYETIRRNMYNLIGRRMHLSYREVYRKIDNWELEHKPVDDNDHQLYDIPNKEIVEIATDPKEIYLMTKDIPTDDEYQKESEMFMEKYYQQIGQLNGLERSVMFMAYDNNGYSGLTDNEIADELATDKKTVSNIKRKIKNRMKKIINNGLL